VAQNWDRLWETGGKKGVCTYICQVQGVPKLRVIKMVTDTDLNEVTKETKAVRQLIIR
jgi:hypothetical protein